MQDLRISDVLGPIMIGPSSSHTAGALRIAMMARRLSTSIPTAVEFRLYGSFAHTYRGHGTDRALVGGILGMDPDDLRIRNSLQLAQEADMEVTFTPLPDAPYDHPNTVDVVMSDASGSETIVRGISIGGGAATLTRINGVDVNITGECTSVIIQQRDTVGVLAHITQSISHIGGNIATLRCYREQRGETAYTVLEVDGSVPISVCEAIMGHPGIMSIRVIPAASGSISNTTNKPDEAAAERFRTLDFPTAHALLEYCTAHSLTIAQAFRAREEALGASHGESTDIDGYLDRVLAVMRAAATEPAEQPITAMGGLIGGEARKLVLRQQSGKALISGQLARAARYAMAVLETNAGMGCIVAAPTAGSSGVIPGTLLTLQDECGFSDEDMREALLCAAAIGYLITRNATVSGAEGGCQAEMGSAAAMAAAAATQLGEGSPAQCFDAAGNAIANMLGLVCDPIAGLVEVPCQKRNASGAANALISAEVALAGVVNLVDFDQTVDAMFHVGRSLPFELRESALGGMAACPAACEWCEGFRKRAETK